MFSKALTIVSILTLTALIACNGSKGVTNTELKTKADSVAYAIGASIGGSMKKDGLDSLNLDILKAGLSAALHGDSVLLDPNKSQMVIQSYLQEKQKVKGEANLSAGMKFLEENKKKPGIVELPDGLQYQVITEGTGAMPGETDTVTVNYVGTLIDGTQFDSSNDHGGPSPYPVNGYIKGWSEALQKMKAGSKWRLFVPPALAYGDRAAGPKIQPNSTLVFELELISVKGK